MKTKTILISALLALWTLTSRADFISGQMLQDLFQSTDGDMATGYVAGVLDMAHDTQRGKSYCPPAGGGVTLQQTAAVVKKYLADNPASWHKDGKVLVLEAIAKAFPCKK